MKLFNFKKVIAIVICLMLCFDIYVCFEMRHRLNKSQKSKYHKNRKINKSKSKGKEDEEEGFTYTIKTTNPTARFVIGLFESIAGNPTGWMKCIKSEWVMKIKDVESEGFVEKQISNLSPLLGTILYYSKSVIGLVCFLLDLGVGKMLKQVWESLTGVHMKRRVFLEGRFVLRKKKRFDTEKFITDFAKSLYHLGLGEKVEDRLEARIKADLGKYGKIKKMGDLKKVSIQPIRDNYVSKLERTFRRINYNEKDDAKAFKRFYLDEAGVKVNQQYSESVNAMKHLENDVFTNGKTIIDDLADKDSKNYDSTVETITDFTDIFKSEKKNKDSLIEAITEKLLVFRKKMISFWKSETMEIIKTNMTCVLSVAYAANNVAAFIAKVSLIIAAFVSGVGIIPYLLILLNSILCQFNNIITAINYFAEIVENPELHVKTYYIGKLIGVILQILTAADSEDITQMVSDYSAIDIGVIPKDVPLSAESSRR